MRPSLGPWVFCRLWWSKDPTLGIPEAKQTNYIGRQEKKISRSPRCPTHTHNLLSVSVREKTSIPSIPTTPGALQLYTFRDEYEITSSELDFSWVTAWTSYGGGTSFEVISGRLTTQKLRHTHDMSGKLPSILLGEKTVERSGGEHPFFCFCCFFFLRVGWWLNMITFCVGFSV